MPSCPQLPQILESPTNARRPISGLSFRCCTRPEPAVCWGSGLYAVGGLVVPVLEFAFAVPQPHRLGRAAALGNGDRLLVILRLEFAEVIDVTAETVHEIEAIVHAPTPPAWRLALSTYPQARRIAPVTLEPKRLGGFELFFAQHRTRVLTLGGDVAVDELDHRNWRRVGRTDAGLDHARVAAVTIGVARREHVEQFGELDLVHQPRVGQTAVAEATMLG